MLSTGWDLMMLVTKQLQNGLLTLCFQVIIFIYVCLSIMVNSNVGNLARGFRLEEEMLGQFRKKYGEKMVGSYSAKCTCHAYS